MVFANHSYILLEDNSVWSIGDNYSGQLGILQTVGSKHTPTKILENILDCTVSEKGGLFIDWKGRLIGVGDNSQGQLGLGSIPTFYSPTECVVKDPTTGDNVVFISVSSGCYHSCAIDDKKDLWVTGNNAHGQIYGMTTEYKTWTKIVLKDKLGNDMKWDDVQCGSYHTMLISESRRELYMMGSNLDYELGMGEIGNQGGPLLVLEALADKTVLRMMKLKNQGLLGDPTVPPVINDGIEHTGTPLSDAPEHRVGVNVFSRLIVIGRTNLALERDGTLWAWGIWNNDEYYAWPKKIFENVIDVKVTGNTLYAHIYNDDRVSNVYRIDIPVYQDEFHRMLMANRKMVVEENPFNKIKTITPSLSITIKSVNTDWERIF